MGQIKISDEDFGRVFGRNADEVKAAIASGTRVTLGPSETQRLAAMAAGAAGFAGLSDPRVLATGLVILSVMMLGRGVKLVVRPI